MSGLSNINHIVVLMLENRSFDNMVGYVYAENGNKVSHVIPSTSSPLYNGLAYFPPRDPKNPFWCPTEKTFYTTGQSGRIFVSQKASNYLVPDPDPEEEFDHMTYQIFGPQKQAPTTPNQMKGFYLDYMNASKTPEQIMQCYGASQVGMISTLAQLYSISDEWFASSPTQTWPNRAFVHLGTSRGQVNNGYYDPFDYDVPTIYNTLNNWKVTWNVYNDTFLESLTRLQLPKLWDPFLDGHFHGFDKFKDDAKNGTLPAYSFLEPSFQIEPNDEHPPHDVALGEKFIYDTWKALIYGKNWQNTLFLITYDEHGGCYDHVAPLFGAKTPDAASNPGKEGFYFNRFGVRVPTLVISPYVQSGTVFRTTKTSPYTPYDHTSVLATLKRWKGIPQTAMPQSERTFAAPTFDNVLTLSAARTDVPDIKEPDISKAVHVSLDAPPSDLQMGMVFAAAAKKAGKSLVADEVADLKANIKTRGQVIDYLTENARRKD